MLKKTITFKDLDDQDVTEDFYFNLSKAEIAEIQLGYPGGFVEHLKKITEMDKPDGGLIMSTFKELITKSVGRRSEDGRRFVKNQEIADEFFQSDAYSVFFMELVTDAEAASKFVMAIMPSDMQKQLGETLTKPVENVTLPAEVTTAKEPTRREVFVEKLKDPNWVPTQQELVGMDQDLFQQAFVRKQRAALNE